MISPISRNPNVQFGRPCLRGTRIPVCALKDAHKAGDGVISLSHGFGISPQQVVQALRWGRKTPVCGNTECLCWRG